MPKMSASWKASYRFAYRSPEREATAARIRGHVSRTLQEPVAAPTFSGPETRNP